MFVSITTAVAVYISTIIVGAFSTALFYSTGFNVLKTPRETTVLCLSGAFIVYVVFELCSAVFYALPYLEALFFIPQAVSDFGFLAFLIFWLRILQELSRQRYPIKLKTIVIITLVYFVAVEFFVFVHSDIIAIEIPDHISEIVIRCLNLLFDLFIPVMAGHQLFALRKNNMNKVNFIATSILAILFILYMLVILYFDMTGYRTAMGGRLYVRLDYIIIVYSIVCVVLTIEFIANFKRSRSTENNGTIESRWEFFVKKYDITKRELEILQWLQNGYENNIIAEKAIISENTVKRHLNHIFSKTDTKSKYELLALLVKEVLK